MNSSPAFISYAHEPGKPSRRPSPRYAPPAGMAFLYGSTSGNCNPVRNGSRKSRLFSRSPKPFWPLFSQSSFEPEWLQSELKDALAQNKVVIPVLNEKAGFSDIPECLRDRQAVAPLDDDHAYQQLLKALGVSASASDDGDDIDNLSFLQRLLKYAANAA